MAILPPSCSANAGSSRECVVGWRCRHRWSFREDRTTGQRMRRAPHHRRSGGMGGRAAPLSECWRGAVPAAPVPGSVGCGARAAATAAAAMAARAPTTRPARGAVYGCSLACQAFPAVAGHDLVAVLDWRAMPELAPLHPPAEVMPDVDEDVEPGEPKHAHIVKVEPGESAAAKVLEARIYGTPIEALCGHVWVPSRDPEAAPAVRGVQVDLRDVQVVQRRPARAAERVTAGDGRARPDGPADPPVRARRRPRPRRPDHARALRVPDGHDLGHAGRRAGAGRGRRADAAARARRGARADGRRDRSARLDAGCTSIPFLDGSWDGQRDHVYLVRTCRRSRPRPV